jgi:hypothetical protein
VILRKRNAHPSSHDLEQNPHSAIVIKVLEFPHEVGKRPCRYAHALSFLQVEVELDVALGIGSLNKALHHPRGNWTRLSAIGEQAVDPKRPIDATPAIAPWIEDSERYSGNLCTFLHPTRKQDVAPGMDQGLVAMSGTKPLGAELLCFCRLGLAAPLSATASGFGSLPMIAAATAGSSL